MISLGVERAFRDGIEPRQGFRDWLGFLSVRLRDRIDASDGEHYHEEGQGEEGPDPLVLCSVKGIHGASFGLSGDFSPWAIFAQ
jgi:hypothetical protein